MGLTKEEKAKLSEVCADVAKELWNRVGQDLGNAGFAPYAQALDEDARRLAVEAR